MKKLSGAVIGLGKQARSDHIPAVIQNSKSQLTAVVEKDKKILASFLTDNPEILGFTSMEVMLKKIPDINFAIVATPHNSHFEITKTLVSRGIDVLKEKPCALSSAEVKEMCNLMKYQHRTIYVGVQRRVNPVYQKYFEYISEIGKPYFINIHYNFFTDQPAPGWRGSKKCAGGGCVIDMGYHMIDLVNWYFGCPDWLYAMKSSKTDPLLNLQIEDTAQIVFGYEKRNLRGSMLLSRVIHPKSEEITIYGTGGVIKINKFQIELQDLRGQILNTFKIENSFNPAAAQLNEFLNVITGRLINNSSPELHLPNLMFIEAAYKSSSLNIIKRIKGSDHDQKNQWTKPNNKHQIKRCSLHLAKNK